MYDRILVPTDGGEHAIAAARHAVELAGAFDATVHAVYVVDTETSWLTVSKSEVRSALESVGRGQGQQALSEVEELAADAGVELVTELLEGAPDERILAYAAEHDIDLVVMGTHGRTGVERRILGSVSERVVRSADAPVMTLTADGGNDGENGQNNSGE